MRARLRTLLVAGVAAGALAACTSNPGPRTVAEDIIDALPSCEPTATPGCLDDAQRDCLKQQLVDTTDEELDAVALAGASGSYGSSFDTSTVGPDWRNFVAQLQEACGLSPSG